MATGPAKPSTSEQAVWEEDTPAPRSASIVDVFEDTEAQSIALARRSESWRLSHLMYLVAASAILIWLGIMVIESAAIGTALVIAGVVLGFSTIMGLGVILARRSSTLRDSLLSLMAIAAERNIPFAPAVAAFADQYGGMPYRRLMALVERLMDGTPVAEALERSRPVASRDAALLAYLGEESGRLPRALRLAANSRSTQLPIWTAITTRLSYIIAVLLVMQTIVGFVLYFVTPKFEAIFRDFNVPLPAVTTGVIEFSHMFVRFGIVTMWIPILEFAALVFMPLSFLTWGNFSFPVLDRIMGRRDTALILRSLGLVVEGGKPIANGLSTLARHYPRLWIRRRLTRLEADVHAGVPWIEALVKWRLIRPAEAEVLRSAAEVGNLSWALFELADLAERRLATRFQLFIQTLFPIVVVLLGMAVFIVAMAYFVPLVALITELTNQ